jgi:large subunit ribosomal protein L4e
MFAPTKVWRKWHVKISVNQRRYALVSSLAASALPALVLARGHKIDQVPEVPLIAANSLESITKTSEAVAALKNLHAYDDVEKVKNSIKLRAGKGKMRNRRFTKRLGPLVVYKNDNGIVQAMRNIPGVETISVERLNLLKLAPGGHLGRFVIWTQNAFEMLDQLYGTYSKPSALKKGYNLPRSVLSNSDISRIINSDEIQSIVRPARKNVRRPALKKNPLKNLGVMLKLNPYMKVVKRTELLAQEKSKAKKAAILEEKRKGTYKAEKKAEKTDFFKTKINV